MRFKKEGFKMESKDYLAYLVEEIHTTVVATVDDAGLPVTAAIDMMDADEGDVYFLTARGKEFYGSNLLPRLFEKNPYMNEIYPDAASRSALTVFVIYEGSGEWFDLSKKPIERASFTFGGAEKVQEGYFITDACIGCKLCYSKCPQKCIDISAKPAVIQQKNCLHCGNCFEICPARAIMKRG